MGCIFAVHRTAVLRGRRRARRPAARAAPRAPPPPPAPPRAAPATTNAPGPRRSKIYILILYHTN